MTVPWSKPLDVGDHIRTGDGPEDRLRIWSLLPLIGRVNVMDARGRMFTVEAGFAGAFRVDGDGR